MKNWEYVSIYAVLVSVIAGLILLSINTTHLDIQLLYVVGIYLIAAFTHQIVYSIHAIINKITNRLIKQ